jgi:type IV secretory pathway TrbD component
MDRFSIFRQGNQQNSKQPLVRVPTALIIVLSVFLAGILFMTGERWIPPSFGMFFAIVMLALLIGSIKYNKWLKSKE